MAFSSRHYSTQLSRSLVSLLLTSWLISFPLAALSCTPAPQKLRYRVLQEKSHNTRLFTQGLLVQGELLVESSGGYGQSLVRRYRADSGKIINQTRLPRQVFAEGIAQVGNQLYLLTWREGVSFVLDAETLAIKGSHGFTGEGWGLTYDDEHLLMSDGSYRLTRRNPVDFSSVGTLAVTSGTHKWEKLNELEYAENLIWANVWLDTRILAIDPETGQVMGILDLSELAAQNVQRPHHDVLNGIAYDPTQDAFWITGKNWPRRYLLDIIWPDAGGDEGNRSK